MTAINMDVVGAKSQESSRTWIANNGLPHELNWYLFHNEGGHSDLSRVVLSMQSCPLGSWRGVIEMENGKSDRNLWAIVLYRLVFFSARIMPPFRILLAIRGSVEVD